ncbi:hypothetical protein HYX13_05030, partial [Candidatus Woesearchaeota archaeon]|nr:hypothetical protein [Candidatus Woesearchaeota archaeon]
MAEHHLIIDHLKFGYEGLFNAAELYNVISHFFYERGWDWMEKFNLEQVTPTGKHIKLILEPSKSVSDFYKIAVSIKVHMTDLKDVEVEQEGKTLHLNHGQIKITFDGYVVSDRSGEWTSKPFYWFLTVLAQKYFFRDRFARMEAWITNDVEDLHERIKTYLNVFKY